MYERFADEVFDELTETNAKAYGEDFLADLGFAADEFAWDGFEEYLDLDLGDLDALEPDCKVVLPTGKGVFIGSLVYRGLTPSDVVDRVLDAGISWLAIERIWQTSKDSNFHNPPGEIRKYVDALRKEVDANFGIWIWGFPHPRDVKGFVSVLVNTASEVDAEGVIADPEDDYYKTWRTKKYKPIAEDLMDRLLGDAHEQCLSVGITSYGKPALHSTMPWGQFSRADFGLPQIYTWGHGGKYPSQCVDGWEEKGFDVVISVLSSAKTHVPRAKNMQDMLARTPIRNCAIAWWSWGNMTSKARWNVVSDARLPKRCSLLLPPHYYMCVVPKVRDSALESDAFLESETEFCTRVSIADKPTPCRFYTIKEHIDAKGLIDLAGRAYGVGSYSTRVMLAQWINNHSYNRRFWKANLATSDFPQGRVSFSPRFSGDIETQARATGPAPGGRALATIFIPPPPAWLGQNFSACDDLGTL